MATKIIKNNRVCVLRQFSSIIVNFKDDSGSWDMLLISQLPLFYNVLRNCLMNLSPYGRNVTLFELSIVLRNLSVLWTFGFASLCWHNSTNPLRVLSKTQPAARGMGYRVWGIGYRLWAIGDWQLAIGDWWLDMGGKAAYPCLYTLHPTPSFYLYTQRFTPLAPAPLPLTYRLIASHLIASRLSPCRLIYLP